METAQPSDFVQFLFLCRYAARSGAFAASCCQRRGVNSFLKPVEPDVLEEHVPIHRRLCPRIYRRLSCSHRAREAPQTHPSSNFSPAQRGPIPLWRSSKGKSGCPDVTLFGIFICSQIGTERNLDLPQLQNDLLRVLPASGTFLISPHPKICA